MTKRTPCTSVSGHLASPGRTGVKVAGSKRTPATPRSMTGGDLGNATGVWRLVDKLRAGQVSQCEFAAFERSVRLIASFPGAGALFPGVRPDLAVRRRVVRGFPFVLAYRVLEARIRIDAVVHTHRRPDYWKRRVGFKVASQTLHPCLDP